MECHDARLLLTLLRRDPNQLDATELDALERHVELCPGCQNWNHSEAKFDAAAAAAVKSVPLPADLKARIASRLGAVPKPRSKAWIGVAASVLFLLGGGVGTYFWTRPEVIQDHSFVEQFDKPSDPQSVENYFADKGYPVKAPPQFEYDYLLNYELAFFQGKLVPRLTFQCQFKNGVVTADVYCLSPRQFRLDEAHEPASSRAQVEIIQHDGQIYLIRCTGGDVSLLKRGLL